MQTPADITTPTTGPTESTNSHRHQRRLLVAACIATASVVTLAAWLPTRFTFGLNASQSLPQRLFLIDKGATPARGDLVAFSWQGGGPDPAGATFIKFVAGVHGDHVSDLDGLFHINCTPIARAKTHGLQGQRLEPGPTGVIPPDHYFVHAPHSDSLDSRYALTGWVSRSHVIGKAYALF
jgi:conjugal transfer pilin signal peptidase TrbI